MSIWELLAVLAYMLMVGYLGYLGWRRTKSTSDYLLAGRKAHPVIMALSYGATFISTSAIVGFGGVAGLFGMSLLWLTAFNIGMGILVAFVLLGGPARRIGHRLDAHTFPEFIGRRFESKFIQVFAGLVIFLFMPLYAAAVLIGGTEFIVTKFALPYNTALLLFAVLTAGYVFMGGLKGVMYTDALQGAIMFVGMIVLLSFTYAKLGGVAAGHEALTNLADLVPQNLQDMGHAGWTAMPAFGFGAKQYDLWWIVVSSIILGVGIGVLAQPQLIVRFMTVKSKKELNRAVGVGAVFILFMTGVAFTVGSLSNAYFSQHGKVFSGQITKIISADKAHAILQPGAADDSGAFVPAGKPIPAVLEAGATLEVGALASGRSIAIVNAGGNPDQIIPTFITQAMPSWFGVLFLLTLLAAAMSTLSSQFHTLGTGIGYDVLGSISRVRGIGMTRLGMIVGIILAVTLSFYARGGYIIARATAIFFGMCASAFLPTFIGGLFFRRVTKAGAIASMITGFAVTTLWLLLVKMPECGDIGLAKRLFGKASLLIDVPNWYAVDPLVVALPASALMLVLVSGFTRKPSRQTLETVFGAGRPAEANQTLQSAAR